VLHLRQYILHPVYILYNPGGLRVWGWDLKHSGGAPVRVVSAVSRPGGAREGARGSAKTPASFAGQLILAHRDLLYQGNVAMTHRAMTLSNPRLCVPAAITASGINWLLTGMAGPGNDLVQFFRPNSGYTGSFCVFGPVLSSPAHGSPPPAYGSNLNRNILGFMRWPQIGLGAQDINGIQRPKSFLNNMAGYRITPVLIFWTLRVLYWVEFTFETGFGLSSSCVNLPCYGSNRNRNILDFMK
jgi:hypothetical protein